jgi:hypothetical protein
MIILCPLARLGVQDVETKVAQPPRRSPLLVAFAPTSVRLFWITRRRIVPFDTPLQEQIMASSGSASTPRDAAEPWTRGRISSSGRGGTGMRFSVIWSSEP